MTRKGTFKRLDVVHLTNRPKDLIYVILSVTSYGIAGSSYTINNILDLSEEYEVTKLDIYHADCMLTPEELVAYNATEPPSIELREEDIA